jgi:PKD repeat protein
MKKLYSFIVAFSIFILSQSAKAQCTANFTFSIGANGNVNFTSTSVGTSSNTMYHWNFGDGSGSSSFSPVASHTYVSNGNFQVYLTIMDTLMSSSCFDTISKTISITNAICGMSANYSYFLSSGGNVFFYDASTGTAIGTTYNWAFGDGTTVAGNPNPVHTYTAGGTYNATLTITDPLSICTSTFAQTVSVTIIPCTLVSSFTYTTGASGLVNFTSTSTGTSANTVFFWDFGDGSFGNGPSTSHTYTNSNMYNVQLNVIDSVMFSCSNTSTQSVNVTNAPCIINSNFTMYKDSFIPLKWNAYPVFPANITGATWSWGDGSSTTGLYPSHTYSAAGWYNICLTVSVSCSPTGSTTCVMTNIFKMMAPNTSGMITVNVINPNASPTGIKTMEMPTASLGIFPNPNSGKFRIELSNINDDGSEVRFELYNLLGEALHSSTRDLSNGTLNEELNLSDLAPGTYFIKASTKSKTYSTKVLITR